MATSAHATVLTNIQGSVMVDRGSGFQPVSVTSPVVAGDRVRAIGGSADIVYNDGLVQKVQSQTVAVLSRGGAGSGPDEQGGFSGDLPLIGAALGVGIGAGVALATNDSDDDGGFGFSVSP
ncbi:hypothetical protein KKP04_05530 [Rhodomicrobium sp. Az07]|uniref:hypothetical protein n=1 Tax=Rhodomicrobium sp. Az07 TaxID=2839034 RepID=UPI001BEAE455|nr:hypothetical protein [Rhodomicrobium sp. Az07]MBT3070326.1 hypothetical protein [Rhodomicrobium sp. Az07]